MKLHRVLFIGLILHLTLCARLSMPSDLVLEALSSSEVKIQWRDNSDSETGYKIFRDGVLIKITSANVTSYVDKNLLPNHTYRYTIKATDDQSSLGKFRLTAYNPPSRREYNGAYPNSSFDDVWSYYKGAYLESVSRIDPTNKGLFESAKKHGLKYYLDIRYIFFEDKLDSENVDYLRGVQYLKNGETVENVDPKNIPNSIIDSIKKLVGKYKDDPYLEGYWICDEPFPSAAGNIARVVMAIKEIDPKHPSILNIARNEWTTENNLTNFFKDTGIDMFSFNFSIFWTDDKYKLEETTEAEQEDAYYKRFAQMQKLSLNLNIPYGFIAQMVGTEYRDPENIKWRTPNIAEYRWEVYTAMVYGVHSLSWFFWEYDDAEDKNSAWGLLDLPAQQRDPIYNAIKSVNKEIFNLKDIMALLRSTEVYHMNDTTFKKKPIVAKNSDTPVIIGLFEDSYNSSFEKKHYFMIVNKDRKKGLMEDYHIVVRQSRYPDAPKDNATVSLEYFNVITNRWEDIDVNNNYFKVYLSAGQGKLFRFSF